MLIHAFIAAIGTGPEPAVFAVFNRLLKMIAYFVRGGFGVAVLV